MNTIIKTSLCIILGIILFKACQMEYTCDVVDSIPREIRERIIEENPECAKISALAKYWTTKGDSLVAEIEKEQEYELNELCDE